MSFLGLSSSSSKTEPLLAAAEKPDDAATRKGDKPKILSDAEKLKAMFNTGDLPVSTEQLGACVQSLMPIMAKVFEFIAYVGKLYVKAFNFCYEYYKLAPKNVIQMCFGLALCGFGGTFTASIAAIEAFRQMGGTKVYDSLAIVIADGKAITEATTADAKVDADGDGIPDVQQITPTELAKREMTVALSAVKEPAKLQEAIAALWAAYIAVLATLKLQFARTTAMAMGIVEVVNLPLMRVAVPPTTKLLGPDLAHWSVTLVDSTIRLIAIIFAWYLQMIISAFYSGLRGGRMFASGLLSLITEHNLEEQVEKLPFVKAPFDPNTSFFAEAILYPVAAIGFFYQIAVGFALPFPLNLVLLPLSIVEWLLRWQITMK